MRKIFIKKGIELTDREIDGINTAKVREFKVPPMSKEQKEKALLFLLKEGERILALGELIPIGPIRFNNENFSVLGIGGIIANEKRKGYGREIIIAIKDYLIAGDKTGVGSCGLHNKIFYEKCGLGVNCSSLRRFVYKKNGKKIINDSDDCVIYQDGPDGFMGKVLSSPDQEVFLERPFDW